MPEDFVANHTFKHSWNTMTSALWRKYPNPAANHMLSTDCFSRELKDGKLIVNRIVTISNPLERWLRHVIGPHMHAIETTVVDRNEKTMTIITRNLTGDTMFHLDEVCTYKPHPDNPHWTAYRQHGYATVYNVPFIGHRVEHLALSNMNNNSPKGIGCMNQLADYIEKNGYQSYIDHHHSIDEIFTLDRCAP